jgi:hypothetical protein
MTQSGHDAERSAHHSQTDSQPYTKYKIMPFAQATPLVGNAVGIVQELLRDHPESIARRGIGVKLWNAMSTLGMPIADLGPTMTQVYGPVLLSAVHAAVCHMALRNYPGGTRNSQAFNHRYHQALAELASPETVAPDQVSKFEGPGMYVLLTMQTLEQISHRSGQPVYSFSRTALGTHWRELSPADRKQHEVAIQAAATALVQHLEGF